MEKSPQDKEKRDSEGRLGMPRPGPNWWLFLILAAMLGFLLLGRLLNWRDEIRYSFFLDQLDAEGIAEVAIIGDRIEGTFKDPPPEAPPVKGRDGQYTTQTDKEGKPKRLSKNFWCRLDPALGENQRNKLFDTLSNQDVNWDSRAPADSTNFLLIVSIVLPIMLFVFLWMMFRKTRDQFLGGGILSSFSKSPAQRFEASDQGTTFADVAGLDSVKADLKELVEFLKSPEKFQRLGGHVPKGVLLMGPPGSGKTLLARAVAGEAGVPFYSVNGSEFIQMFVGVGASRVRDLFKTAKESSPAIIFIDEIDAVGRQRGAGLGGGHDEREQTLNQILSEMDGFNQTDSVIVVAATNRPDVLDPALLRPGRFDRHVTVDRPTQKGRREIFKVHVRDVPLADDVDLQRMAAGTVGLTGADIRNIVNEAALWAARHDKSKVEMEDFEYARDKVLMGPKREEVLLDKEKEQTAYHEAGHALLAWITPGPDRVHKVTVIPRGRMLGATEILPEEDRMSISEGELHNRLSCLLGGRAAEELIFNEHTAGAANDLEQATRIARRMVTQWGMSERLGPVNYKISDEDPFLGREMHQLREFSEHTMQVIDEEVAKVLHAAADRAYQVLNENRDHLDKLAGALIEHEELDVNEITELIGPAVDTQIEGNGQSGVQQPGLREQGRPVARLVTNDKDRLKKPLID